MFTPFLIKDQEAAATLAERLASEADAQPQLSDAERLARVMTAARNVSDQGETGLAQHAPRPLPHPPSAGPDDERAVAPQAHALAAEAAAS